MGILTGLKPEKVFECFEYLCSVPHGSGNTKKISDLIVEFAKKNRLEYYQDDLNNVIIYKKASEGYENCETIILQSHIDMVCTKTEDCTKDMSKEPIDLLTDGEFVWADKTSLGGDDGIGAAMAMAILTDENVKHPRLEAVFTVDEESGMWGAHGIDASKISGRKMINIDNEDDKFFTVGCAGGKRIDCILPVKREEPGKKGLSSNVFAVVTLENLTGGHSGVEIGKERGNANVLLARILHNVSKRVGIRLCAFRGGRADNVITSQAEAKVAVPKDAYRVFEEEIRKSGVILKNEYKNTDPDMKLSVLGCGYDENPVSREDTVRILSVICALPYGVQGMSTDIEGLVETSLNLGITVLSEESFKATYSLRSSVKTKMDALEDKLKTIVNAFGGKISTGSSYPGWSFKHDSELREKLVKAYETVYGTKPVFSVIHAGVECGIFSDKLPGLDCVSIGPDISNIHSTEEKLVVKSVEMMYEVIVSYLGFV